MRSAVDLETAADIDNLGACGIGDEMTDLSEVAQAHIEWRAWRTVCHELERAGVQLNNDDRLAAALRLWGEELVGLRDLQEPGVAESAAVERREVFDRVGLVLAQW